MNGRRYFSGYIRMIAEATDHDTAMKVALEWGGRRVRIPERVTPLCTLARLVGPEKAAAIVAKLGGEVINVSHEKINLVHWLRERGLSRQEIAHELRMSLRTVQYMLNGNTPSLGSWPEGADA
jgi:DNA-binding NarL/FixJ family response regulator